MLKIWFDESVFQELYDLRLRFFGAMNDLRNRTKVHQRAKEHMIERWQVNFDSQGAIYGAWKPHSPKTVELWGPHTLLVRKGTLRSGLISQAHGGRVRMDATEWDFSRNPSYFFAHHFGNANRTQFAIRRGFGPVPARKLFGINGEDQAWVTRVTEEYCDEVIARWF